MRPAPSSQKPIILNADPGPWGKPKGPSGPGGGWTPGNGGGNRKPPGDFDDLVGDIKRYLHDFFGGEHGNRGLTIAFVAFVLLWLASGIYQVQPGEQGVVLRFGSFEGITASGLRYHLPAPFESVVIVNSESVRNAKLGGPVGDGGRSGNPDDEILMLTGDENIINIGFNIQWKVRDSKAFVFNVADPDQTVLAVSESAMREVIGRTPIESALTEGKSKIQDETQKLIQATLDSYGAGIQILQVNLLDASFPAAVVDAARDVQAARADQERSRNEAQAYTNDILPRARGQAARMVQEAEGYKQQVVAQAQGDAARFDSVYSQYTEAKDVTRKRIYLETMEKILTGTTKIIVGNKSGMLPYMPLPELKPAAKEAR